MVIMQRFVRMLQKVVSAWCTLEDLQCKENDRKSKIGGHRSVSDEWTHQQIIPGLGPSVMKLSTAVEAIENLETWKVNFEASTCKAQNFLHTKINMRF